MSPHSAGWREVSRAAPVFAALGDETRLALVARLSSDGPLSITRLTAGSAVTRQAVTKHLNVLAAAGVGLNLRQRRAGVWVPGPEENETGRSIFAQVSQPWEVARRRLERVFQHTWFPRVY